MKGIFFTKIHVTNPKTNTQITYTILENKKIPSVLLFKLTKISYTKQSGKVNPEACVHRSTYGVAPCDTIYGSATYQASSEKSTP